MAKMKTVKVCNKPYKIVKKIVHGEEIEVKVYETSYNPSDSNYVNPMSGFTG